MGSSRHGSILVSSRLAYNKLVLHLHIGYARSQRLVELLNEYTEQKGGGGKEGKKQAKGKERAGDVVERGTGFSLVALKACTLVREGAIERFLCKDL